MRNGDNTMPSASDHVNARDDGSRSLKKYLKKWSLSIGLRIFFRFFQKNLYNSDVFERSISGFARSFYDSHRKSKSRRKDFSLK